MGNERLIVATGIRQGIGKNGHAVEGSFFVNRMRQIDNRRSEPMRVDGDATEGVAEDVTE
jgi:hypothetical protein